MTSSKLPDRQRIVAFSGNAGRPSRSRQLASLIARRIAAHVDAEIEQFDIADMGPGLATSFERDQLPAPVRTAIAAIEQADILVAVSPVYKGSYSGLFKHVFDLVDMDALVGRPVVLGATGGGPRHSLVVEHQLRPLFGFFSALTIPTAVYAEAQSFDEDGLNDPTVMSRVEAAALQCAELARALGCRRNRQAPAAAPRARVVPIKS